MNTKQSISGIVISLALIGGTTLIGSSGSVAIGQIPLFAICSLVILMIHLIVFIPSWVYKTEHYFDVTGSLSYLGAVGCAYWLNPDTTIRQTVLASLIAIWALRLGTFLFLRVKRIGKDVRFDQLKQNFLRFAMTWCLSALWVILTSAAALAALTTDTQDQFDIFMVIGMLTWIVGFAFEFISDIQKNKFRADPRNDKKFITSGLWAWSRHPNYFGEIMLWFGIAIIAFPVLSGLNYATLLSPIFVWLLLTKVSGVPLLEAKAEKQWGSDDNYIAFKNATPVLVPWSRPSK
jgi:steroid 5-alpha reductase family enzyme